MPDLSQQTGNPTSYIHDNYQDLMALSEQDPEAAAIQVIQAAESMVGTGLSVLNFRKLKMRAMKAAQRGAFGIQKFLSDYLLGGTDPSLKVSSVSRFEELDALGSLISEDIDRPPIEWTRDLLFIEEVARNYGLMIVREEGGSVSRLALDVVNEFGHRGITPEKIPPEWDGIVPMKSGIPVHYEPDNPSIMRVWDNWGSQYVDLIYKNGAWHPGGQVDAFADDH